MKFCLHSYMTESLPTVLHDRKNIYIHLRSNSLNLAKLAGDSCLLQFMIEEMNDCSVYAKGSLQ